MKKVTLMRIESQHSAVCVVYTNEVEYIRRDIVNMVQNILKTRGKTWEVQNVSPQCVFYKEWKRTADICNSFSELCLWAGSVSISWKKPKYKVSYKNELMFILRVPNQLKLHLSVDNDVFCENAYRNTKCYMNYFIMENDSRMFPVDKNAVAERILQELKNKGLKGAGASIHHTDCGDPMIYTTGFKIHIRKEISLKAVDFDKDLFAFYKITEVRELEGYETVED